MDRIDGRTAFVTGGASGIGLAIAETLVAEGARVAVADWNSTSLERQTARLGPSVLALELDVRDRAGWQQAKKTTEDTFGPIEILVNNAGVGPDQHELADMPPEHFDRLVAIMLTGMFNGIHTFAAAMRDRAEGHVVNTASMAGLVASARLGAYTAAKFAVVGMTEVLRAEMEPHGVGVSVLCPGLVRTNLGSDNPNSTLAERQAAFAAGIDPSLVGAQVVDAIRHNDLYVITHGEYGRAVDQRAARLRRAFDEAPKRGSADNLPGTQVEET
jgi:NAD(P)-dependent dehydrogenase (short-subunit alcohol dehydrogenase family)